MKIVKIVRPKGKLCGTGKDKCKRLIEQDFICTISMDLGANDKDVCEKCQECLDNEDLWLDTDLKIDGKHCGDDCKDNILNCHGTENAGHYCSVYDSVLKSDGDEHLRCKKCLKEV